MQTNGKIKAVLFDLDNTLVDFAKIKREACRAAVDAMIKAGLKAGREGAMRTLFELYREHGLEHREIFQKLAIQLEGRVDYSVVAAGIVAYRRVRESMMEPYPDVKPTLEKLKHGNLILGIVTDAPRIKAWVRLAYLGLNKIFDLVITNDDTGERKSGGKPFEFAAEKLAAEGIKPREILFVGDSFVRDLIPAAGVGMKTCHAKYGSDPGEPQGHADYTLERFGELLEILGCRIV